MSFELKTGIPQHPDIAHLQFFSPDSLEQHLDAAGQLVAANQSGLSLFLIDFSTMTKPTRLSREEQFHFSTQWQPEVFLNSRFAVVLPEDPAQQSSWYFMTHLIKELGTNGMIFSNTKEGIQWLLSP